MLGDQDNGCPIDDRHVPHYESLALVAIGLGNVKAGEALFDGKPPVHVTQNRIKGLAYGALLNKEALIDDAFQTGKFIVVKRDEAEIQLDERMAGAMSYVVRGYSAHKTARKMGWSSETGLYNYRFDNIYSRFKVRSMTAFLVRLYLSGFLVPGKSARSLTSEG